MTEIWRDIAGYEGAYQVSNCGRIKSLTRRIAQGNRLVTVKERILSASNDDNGYKTVVLSENGKHKTIRVHRLVAMAFLPNLDKKSDVNHKNGRKDENNVGNLEWASHKENTDHSWENKLTKMPPPQENIAISQLEIDGKLIGNYSSIKDAADITGIDSTSICKCCKGKRKTAGGFIWRYKNGGF